MVACAAEEKVRLPRSHCVRERRMALAAMSFFEYSGGYSSMRFFGCSSKRSAECRAGCCSE